jgi:hypothetical protein
MDELADDEFDGIDLDDLEERAIASTQQAPAGAVESFDLIEDGFDDEVINLDEPLPPQLRPTRSHTQPAPPQDEATSREQWRQQRYGASSRQDGQRESRQPIPQAQDRLLEDQSMIDAPEEQSFDVDTLQSRIAELEGQQATHKKTAEDAKAAFMSKTGEIAIVRANHDKTAKEYERRLAVMQQLHAEEVAKQRAELDRLRRDRDKVETDNRFLQHDLAQEAERSKGPRRTLAIRPSNGTKPAETAQPSPTSTPKKDKSLTIRDGFNDDEVIFISPTKAKERSKASTPKGVKRKRTIPEANQSPGSALPMIHDESPMRPVETVSPPRNVPTASIAKYPPSTNKFKVYSGQQSLKTPLTKADHESYTESSS